MEMDPAGRYFRRAAGWPALLLATPEIAPPRRVGAPKPWVSLP